MDESSIIAVGAALFEHEITTDSWVPIDTEMSRVDIYYSACLNAYRIIGVDVNTAQYTLNSAIFSGLIYQRVSDTFHQCIYLEEVNGSILSTSFGLNFRSFQEALQFGEKMDFCFGKLSEPVSTDKGPTYEAPIPTTTSLHNSGEVSNSTNSQTSMARVITELHNRMQQVTKEIYSTANDATLIQDRTSKYLTRRFQENVKPTTKPKSQEELETNTKDLLLNNREAPGNRSEIKLHEYTSPRARSKDMSPRDTQLIEFSSKHNSIKSAKGNNINTHKGTVTHEELELLKKELFAFIDQWKMDIIAAYHIKRERSKALQ